MAIEVPHEFADGEIIDAARFNNNFDELEDKATDKTGDTLTGTLNTRALIPTATGTYALGSSGSRYAAIYTTVGLVEQARTTAAGVWANVTYDAADFTSNAGTWTVQEADVITNRYTVIGNTMHYQVAVQNTVTSGVTLTLEVLLPDTFSGGGVGFMTVQGFMRHSAGATEEVLWGLVSATKISFSRLPVAAFPNVSDLQLYFSGTFEISD